MDQLTQLNIQQLAGKIFFCGSSKGSTPIAYVKDRDTVKQLTNLLRSQAKLNPHLPLIKVKRSSSLALEKTRSLEEILAKLPHDQLLFDPTSIVERATALLSVAKQARQCIGAILKGCYFNSEKRNIHFLVKLPTAQTDNLLDIKNKLESILLQHSQHLSFLSSISVSEHQPAGEVIAIERQSWQKRSLRKTMKGILNKLKGSVLLVSASSNFGFAHAAIEPISPPLPAVSNLNAWVGGSGDYLHDSLSNGWGGMGEAGVAAPLIPSLGVQLYGFAGTIDHQDIRSLDGYLFWRNPADGLLGPHLTYSKNRLFAEHNLSR
jgi:hypothetical protein